MPAALVRSGQGFMQNTVCSSRLSCPVCVHSVLHLACVPAAPCPVCVHSVLHLACLPAAPCPALCVFTDAVDTSEFNRDADKMLDWMDVLQVRGGAAAAAAGWSGG